MGVRAKRAADNAPLAAAEQTVEGTRLARSGRRADGGSEALAGSASPATDPGGSALGGARGAAEAAGARGWDEERGAAGLERLRQAR